MSGDNYIKVGVTFIERTEKAVWVEKNFLGKPPIKACIPRSCLHAASDIAIRTAARWSEITLLMRRWKAKEAGLI